VAELQLTIEERKPYLNFRPAEYLPDEIADELDVLFQPNSHSSWKCYNFILILMVLDIT
jgi:hypothetical protein